MFALCLLYLPESTIRRLACTQSFSLHLSSCVPNCVSDIFDDAALFICHYCRWCCVLSFSQYSTNLVLFGPCDGKHISSMPILFASKNLFIGCGSTCAYITAAWLFNSQCWLACKRLMATIKMFKISNILGEYNLNTFSLCLIPLLLCVCVCIECINRCVLIGNGGGCGW